MERLPGMMTVFSLAEALHKDVDEILAMPSKRFTYWIAYFNVRKFEDEKRMKESELKSRVSRRR